MKLCLFCVIQEEVHSSKDKMITYAYVKLGPKAQGVSSGFMKIEFPMSKLKEKEQTTSRANGSSLDLGLEGQIGALQKECYHDLIKACKEIAKNMGVTQWTTIMSVQVCIYRNNIL